MAKLGLGLRFDEDEVWLYYHHVENYKKLKMIKGAYCDKFGLNKVKFGNMKYVIGYCKAKSLSRYRRMMALLDEFDKAVDDITVKDFCKSHRVSTDDFYVASRHREFTWIILKRVAENYPAPELIEVVPLQPEVDVNLADPELATQEVMVPDMGIEPIELVGIADDPALARKRGLFEMISIVEEPESHEIQPNPEVIPEEITREPIINPEKLDEIAVFDPFEHLAVDEEVVKPKFTLSDFISKRKLSENLTPDEPINTDSELDESSDEEVVPPAKRSRKPKALEFDVADEPHQPMKFFALNTPQVSKTVDDGIGRIGEGSWSDRAPAPNVHSEPEIQLKGNRIELTFTKTVRLTAAPDTPQAQLLDIINLLKDL